MEDDLEVSDVGLNFVTLKRANGTTETRTWKQLRDAAPTFNSFLNQTRTPADKLLESARRLAASKGILCWTIDSNKSAYHSFIVYTVHNREELEEIKNKFRSAWRLSANEDTRWDVHAGIVELDPDIATVLKAHFEQNHKTLQTLLKNVK